MPTYAYACTQCEHRFEAHQAFTDPSLTECPVCGGALRKQYGSVGVTFNGSGFYRTDSRKTEKSSSSSGESSSGGSTSGGSSSGGGSGSSAGSKSDGGAKSSGSSSTGGGSTS